MSAALMALGADLKLVGNSNAPRVVIDVEDVGAVLFDALRAKRIEIVHPDKHEHTHRGRRVQNLRDLRIRQINGKRRIVGSVRVLQATIGQVQPLLVRQNISVRQWVGPAEALDTNTNVPRGSLSIIQNFDLDMAFFSPVFRRRHARQFGSKVGPELSLSGIAGDPIGSERKPESGENRSKAGTAQPSGERGGIRRLPLGAKIGISAIIALFAWFSLFRALRPFGLLAFNRRDIGEGVGYGLLGLGLLALSYWVGVAPRLW